MNAISKSRRRALRWLAAGSAVALTACVLPQRPVASERRARNALALLEQAHGGRLGVHALDTGSGATLDWRGDERFALCSTFKLLLAGLVLREIEAGRLDGDAPIAISTADLVPHAPVVRARLDQGGTSMTALELARATQVTSDNVAGNLLLRQLGGPAAFTARLRGLGDRETRLDRWEPELNLVPPGELRDTTTPRAMAGTTARLAAGDALGADSKALLAQWLVDTGTGLRRLRAGLPAHWRLGDKTGTGIHPTMANKHNDVAVAWPPDRAPLVIAAYWEADGHHRPMRESDDAVLAQVGRIVGDWAARDQAGLQR